VGVAGRVAVRLLVGANVSKLLGAPCRVNT
jgi:hypothetical protein